MEIHGIPGSLQELLKPLKGSILPLKHIDDIQGDFGSYLASLRRYYRRKHIPYSIMLEEGAKGEYYLMRELQRLLHQQEGHLFNQLRISNEDETCAGYGLNSYPDHLMITPYSFTYIETKRWRKPEKKMIQDVVTQMQGTLKNLERYLAHQNFSIRPAPVLYDDLGTFPETGPYPVIRSPRELVQQLSTTPKLPEYQQLVMTFSKL